MRPATVIALQDTTDSSGDAVFQAALAFVFGIVGATVLLALPGYVLSSTATRGRGKGDGTDREFIARTAVGGIVVHAIWLPWTLRLVHSIANQSLDETWKQGTWLPVVAWALVVLIATPVVLGLLVAWFLRVESPAWLAAFLSWLGISEAARTVDAWEWAMSRQVGWVRASVKRGDEVVDVWGVYSDESAVGTKDKRDLFLQERWSTADDGWIGAREPGTTGVWLSADSIVAVDFFEGSD